MALERVENRLGVDFGDAVETLFMVASDGFLTTEPGSDVPTVWPASTGYDVTGLTDLLTKLEDVIVPALRVAISGRALVPDMRWDGEPDVSISVMEHSA